MTGTHDQFVITIARHRVLGNILQPCWVSEWESSGYFSAFERISNDNLMGFADRIGSVGQTLVHKCEEFGDKQLMRNFWKKKVVRKSFTTLLPSSNSLITFVRTSSEEWPLP